MSLLPRTRRQRSEWYIGLGLLLFVALLVGLYVAVLLLEPRGGGALPPETGPPVVNAPAAGAEAAYAGLPRGGAPVSVLTNTGFTVGYSETRKDPLWVAYRLFRVKKPPYLPRPAGFEVDPRTRAKVAPAVYTGSGYDRGHLAPNDAIADCYGVEAQRQTFLMSNICPQRPDLNRGPWKDLEGLVARRYTTRAASVWVMTGPIFAGGGAGGTGKPAELRGGVQVPARFYKIAAAEQGEGMRVFAWDFPQDAPPHAPLRGFLTSVDAVEAATGLDFFPDLDPATQAKLEAAAAPTMW